ncbi:response regulator transcription factor [Synechococcus sp. AH-603-L18]|nr:response regulator transcription factor [Synechococcus sp. AH-603-L18]MDB4338001.1 response regulator transcription factor [Synechococcus sp. AH-603-L18]
MEYDIHSPSIEAGRKLVGKALEGHSIVFAVGNRFTLTSLSFTPLAQRACVGAFTTSNEVLENLSRKPTLLICSEWLEQGDGISLIQKAKSQLPELKALIFLDRDNSEVISDSCDAGADGICITSQLGSGQFAVAIETILRGGVYLPHELKTNIQKDEPRGVKKLEMLSDLTDKEIETLTLLCQGKSNNEISQSMFTSLPTTKSHVSNILSKFEQYGVSSRTGAVVLAVKNSLVDFDL